MRSPEMSYSPAYYQDQGPLGTTHPRSSIVTPPPATRRSQEQSSILGHPVGGSRPSSPIPSRDVSPRTSGSRAHRVYHNQTLGGPSWPGSDIRETDSAPAGSTSSGAHKEERAPSSWADRPSLMSGEHSNPSIIRVRKRAIPDDEIITNEGQDALLMLVSVQCSGPMFHVLIKIDSSASQSSHYTHSVLLYIPSSPSSSHFLSHLSASAHFPHTSAPRRSHHNFAISSLLSFTSMSGLFACSHRRQKTDHPRPHPPNGFAQSQIPTNRQ